MKPYIDRLYNPMDIDGLLALLRSVPQDYDRVDLSMVCGCRVSTVWTGIRVSVFGGQYETMVFGADGTPLAMVRYRNEPDAHAGHRAMVARVWGAVPLWAKVAICGGQTVSDCCGAPLDTVSQ